MAIISVQDVIDFGDLGDLSPGQITAASIIIDTLQDEIEDYLRRSLAPAEFTDEKVIRGGWSGNFYFSRSPLREILSLTADGQAVSADSYSTASWGIERLLLPILSLTESPVLVATYVAGWDEGDPRAKAVRAKLLPVALREITRNVIDKNPGVSVANVEGESVNYAGMNSDQGTGGWTTAEKKALRKFKRPGGG